ncbi:NAD(P)-dependent oxidoreductase [Paraburkholderia fungorum]|jgi:4-hydroxybutyrate dehydrogenase/sulfolactaldehyde 3-reductase|uniref:NAD(P)-dependent oxidoreductase n=1 Tax=Paraburkholderia fungorum TaxID=134537 RepID=A0AAP5QHE8_9BURK|nr:NAD(P)-dependent oxidoreductase [Paraburkholderia fungorum]MDT8842257.1 NAD(P)-dependent oxidoreductase [Paraburkholderia fungorum]PRZ51334.1 4-hydroxybutyrate dehydrogenase/sulfolactaldehyde 3-reductase [Paraburkholderia fungorum]QLD50682.1 NAD(P)-dependent oxidoreductase [Paraburkholderia fungorum]USU17829.1 NAD(P)-dependent oxidoreductase [Paraburkholderia fungorum]USU25773.1 NAD(P)-dependent oxidoreductase [Paraburkholderia fungorum]
MEKIGFIGLGRMGKPMAANLRKRGFELVVMDLNRAAVAELVELGARAGESVAQIARDCPIVVTMLPSSVEVEQVALGEDGIFAHAARGSVLLDMSTIDPLATDRLEARAREQGLSVVDAPVGRLAEHADRGESLFMVGASDADFARVKPLLDAMGTTVYHCGAVGTGGRTKLVNNYVAVTLCQVNAEALALSQRFGLDITRTLQVLYGTSASNGQLRMNFPNKVLAGDTTPGFTIDLAHKDMALVLGAAHAAKVPMPVAAAVFESFSLARASEYGRIDFSGIADAICDLAKIDRARVPKGWTAS